MSEQESFEELLKEEEKEIAKIYKGAVVTGKVFSVEEDFIRLGLKYKKEAILPKNLYSDDPSVNLLEEVQEGDELTVKVLNTQPENKEESGCVLVSYRDILRMRQVQELRAPFENQEVLKGTVEKANKGLVVFCHGAQVFIPASLVAPRFEKNLDKYVGKEVEFVIVEFEPEKRRIIGDRKQVVAKAEAEAKEALFSSIAPGQVVTGKVKSLTKFGAFIELGGVDGLLHNTEMTWGKVRDAKSIYKVGDEATVYIKDIDVENERIGLSARFPEANPWTEDGPYSLGKTVTGKVVRFAKFGAFVELEPGIDGLLHVSEIAYERTAKAEDVLKAGQEITAKVIKYEIENNRINLSIKALLPEPESTPVYKDEEAEPATIEAPAVEEAVEAPVEEAPVEEVAEAPAE